MHRRGYWHLMAPDGASGGGDGMGGEASAAIVPREEDEILDDPTYSDGPEFEMDPELTLPVESRPAGEEDPWSALGDDARELAEKKGWKSPEDLARAYRELEFAQGKRGEEEGRSRELEQRLAVLQGQLEAMRQSPQQQQPQQNGFQPDRDAIDELFSGIDFNQLSEAAGGDPGTALAIYQDQVMLPRFRQLLGGVVGEVLETVRGEVGTRTAPLEQGVARMALRDQAAQLVREFPEEFPKMREEVQARMTRDPALLNSPDGMRRAFADALMEQQLEQRRRRAPEGEALIGGSRLSPANAPPPDPAKLIRDAIESAVSSPRDGL